MSDFEDDIDDELLELAGASEKKRRKRQGGSPSKRRKADVESESENDVESEEESHPYPLEGKYIDAADRDRLEDMPEIEREEILAQRMDELQRKEDKRNLTRLLNAQNNRNGDDSVSQAAKRQHGIRGATKEKSRKLDELKAKRKAKDDKKRTKTNSPRRDRSSSPMDMETSSEEDEDGQITKVEQEDERDRRKLGLDKPSPEDEPITLEDLNRCRLSRDLIVQHCLKPWFEEYLKGAWVRYMIGSDQGQPIYRACEVLNLAKDVKPYQIESQTVNQAFELRHGKAIREFNMDKVSNAPITQKEFDRVIAIYPSEQVKLPTKKSLVKKHEQMQKLLAQPMTEGDITTMLARKAELNVGKPSAANLTMEKSQLNQRRTLALRRGDLDELREIDAKLAELVTRTAAAGHVKAPRAEDLSDLLAKVNERNRKANAEGIRRAEMHEAERRRRDRKLAASGAATPVDPSARLRTVPRTFERLSRQGTPNPGTPTLQGHLGDTRSVSPLPPSALPTASPQPQPPANDVSVLDAVEVDLGDF